MAQLGLVVEQLQQLNSYIVQKLLMLIVTTQALQKQQV
ncbi:hypothetical protein DR85_501 [Francisella tularensis]|uniref:Uncharacterized protein n=1 Tax=Francisella tularensis TaxID=263 RepID=A0AAW3D6M4_FRATU|nr:hypothetical protein DR85_501 [Francisella tularensis]KFJ40564.1 hypothetical protein DR87_1745 [Francisella tularensis]